MVSRPLAVVAAMYGLETHAAPSSKRVGSDPLQVPARRRSRARARASQTARSSNATCTGRSASPGSAE
jgi:hypothetical protein